MGRRLLALAGVAAASLAAALLLGEAALRAIGYAAPIWYQPDPVLGWTLRPGVTGWFRKEGGALVSVNPAGRRDEHVPMGKPDGVYRIAVLGDSYSEAFQVEREQAYWALLPRLLQQCGFQPGKRFQVLNFGVSGYGTGQQYLTLVSRAFLYQPDLVLLQFTNGNDVQNNSAALETEKVRPFFVRGPDGRLRVDDAFAGAASFRRSRSLPLELMRQASDRSRVLQLLRDWRKASAAAPAAELAADAGAEQGLEPVVLAPPRDEKWREAWLITEALIAMTADHAQRNGARFLLFSVPYAIQVHPDRTVRARMESKLGVPDLLYPDQRLAQFGKRSGVPVLPLAPEMQRLAEERGAFFHGFENGGIGRGHWNPEGHRVAAQLIARRICAPG
jgi:hypothetical protein